MSKLAGKVSIVTDSSKGIGGGIATRLAADGAAIIVNYSRSVQDADAVVICTTDAGGRAIAVRADNSKPEEIKPLINSAIKHFGRLDILINNAGVYKVDSLDALTPENFD